MTLKSQWCLKAKEQEEQSEETAKSIRGGLKVPPQGFPGMAALQNIMAKAQRIQWRDYRPMSMATAYLDVRLPCHCQN